MNETRRPGMIEVYNGETGKTVYMGPRKFKALFPEGPPPHITAVVVSNIEPAAAPAAAEPSVHDAALKIANGPAGQPDKLREPTEAEVLALRRWANEKGPKWKMWLREAWMYGHYGDFPQASTLQQIRNTFGPSWLADFKFPKSAS